MINFLKNVVLVLVVLHRVSTILTENESNIQRLSKPEMIPSIRVDHPNYKLNESFTEKEGTVIDRKPLVGFSKNNPELDWKKYLTIAEKDTKIDRDLDLDFVEEKLGKTANSIQWLSDLYDPLKWKRIPGKLTENCKEDMDMFLHSLRNGSLWAAKMFDASGRYSSQFHFGNDFWLGSSTSCKELGNPKRERPLGLTQDSPPYPIRFHVARMYLTLPSDVAPSARQIFLGLCLPGSCDRVSLTSMLRATADRVEREGNFTHRTSGPKIHIAKVKPVPASDYTPWLDPKVHILSGVAGVMLLLMILATIYEYNDTRGKESDVESSSSGNNNERISTYPDKNFPDERRISIIQDNSKELIEKIAIEDKKGKTERNDEVREEKGFWVKCLLAFHPISNGSKIISTEAASRDSLTCLHGLRVFSLGWVVMVHTYLQMFSIAENKTLRTVTERNFMFQTVSNATFSVDTFFFISGLLLTILYYRSLGGVTKTHKKNFFKTSALKFSVMIFYRFVRLTPAYLFALGMNEVAMRQGHARTVFFPVAMDHLTCEKYWWRNALYINSLYPRTEMCMLWSWYMANDTQFYVLGIFLLLLSVKYFKLVSVSTVFLIVSSWFTTFSIAYQNDYVARIQEPFALFDELYDKPWLRAGPYLIGTITGYILFKTNCSIRTPLYAKIIGWLVSASVMFSVVYGLYPGSITVTLSSVYVSLGHTAWAVALSFIVVQCCTGSAPIVDGLLSLRLMYPLSRLTYCAYLVHPIIMMITTLQMDGPLHLHNGIVLIVYFGNLVASYLLSFCISLTFEAPVINLLKIAFGSKKRTR